MVDWNKIVSEVVYVNKKKNGNIKKFEKDLREILKDGSKKSVGELVLILEKGYNEGKGEDDKKIKVNWSSVYYCLDNRDNIFVEVKGEKNVFKLKSVKMDEKKEMKK